MRPITNFGLHSALAVALLVFAAASAGAAAYIKYGSIKGESAVKDGKVGDGWIEIDSWSFGATNTGASSLKLQPGGGKAQASAREASAPSISEISVTKSADKASPVLMKPLVQGSLTVKLPIGMCNAGARHPTATLETPYMRYEMENVMVSSCSTGSGGGGSGDAQPMESVSLNYEKITMTHVKQDKKKEEKIQVRGWDPEKKEE